MNTFLSLRPTNRLVYFYVFSSSLLNSLSYLSLTLYPVQMTVSTCKVENILHMLSLIDNFRLVWYCIEITSTILLEKCILLLKAVNSINNILLELSNLWLGIQISVFESWSLKRPPSRWSHLYSLSLWDSVLQTWVFLSTSLNWLWCLSPTLYHV